MAYQTGRYCYGFLGFLMLAWGITQFVFLATSFCAAKFPTTTVYRTGGGAGDDFGWVLPQVTGGAPFSSSILGGFAAFIYGLSMILQIVGSSDSKSSCWGVTMNQIANRYRPSRWLTLVFVFPFVFAITSYFAGISDAASITGIALLGATFAFAHSVNGALNCPDALTAEDRKKKNSVFERSDPLEAWLFATLIMLAVWTLWIVYLVNGARPTTVNDGLLVSVVVVEIIFTFILHFLVLSPLTNYSWCCSVSNTAREWIFVFVVFVIVLYPTILMHTSFSSASCPT